MPTASQVIDHFVSRCDWVDPETTVDRVIVGDPEKEVSRCLVTWLDAEFRRAS